MQAAEADHLMSQSIYEQHTMPLSLLGQNEMMISELICSNHSRRETNLPLYVPPGPRSFPPEPPEGTSATPAPGICALPSAQANERVSHSVVSDCLRPNGL